MCGIFAIFNFQGTYDEARQKGYDLSKRQRHRGPDSSGIVVVEIKQGVYHVFCHERLNIVDLTSNGKQPFKLVDNENVIWLVNGELYNYIEDYPKLQQKYKIKGSSDCSIVGPMYKEFGVEQLWQRLDGMWGIILYDNESQRFYIGRDHVGIIPIYWGIGSHGELYVSSELKTFHDQVQIVQQLIPGHYLTNEAVPIQWYDPSWFNMDLIPTGQVNYQELRERLVSVVKRELMGDAPFGLFISGGVDSSIIASIVMRLVKSGEIDIKKRGMTKVHSFCIGLEDSPDLHYARQVADFLGTEHHSLFYTVEEGLDQIPEVIFHTETFNNTTIRASTPMYAMCRMIKALGIKTCLTGEGSDELFGGYLYFHKAPNREEFHKECIRKVRDLYKYDLLRANKSCLAWGIEVRPPFLNKGFIEYVMQLDPTQKVTTTHNPPIEKYILRKAFDDENDPFVPKDILWRQKEQFSDGVGYKWRDGIRSKVERIITDQMFDDREITYPLSTPKDKEQYWYRQIFSKNFPSDGAMLTVPFAKSIACSTEAALEWDESFKKNVDESGRSVLQVHQEKVFEQHPDFQFSDKHFYL